MCSLRLDVQIQVLSAAPRSVKDTYELRKSREVAESVLAWNVDIGSDRLNDAFAALGSARHEKARAWRADVCE